MMMVVSSTSGLIVVFLLSLLSSSEAALCSTVNCTEAECKPLLNSYLNECATAFVPGGNCSQACKNAYDQLLESEYFECSCGNDSWCNQSTHFFGNCFNGVRPSPPPVNAPEDCNLNAVASACNQDPTCGPLLVAYLHECRFAFQGINCSQHCKQALNVVLQDPVGKRLGDSDCSCGNDVACQTTAQNLVVTCFSPQPSPAVCTSFDVVSSCDKDPTCKPHLSAYQDECRFAFQGLNCSQQCKQAFVNLLQDPVGNRFTVCHCATQDTACQSVSQNLSTTCFNGTFPGVQPQEPTPAQMAAFLKDNAAYIKGNVHIVLVSATMGFLLLFAQ